VSDLGWRADGIERARAAGGVELEVYRRPGFVRGAAVRRSNVGDGGSGFSIESDPDPFDDDDRAGWGVTPTARER
jgi:hypothetical protein